MIGMNAVDIVQPDLCYIGGFTRAQRVARMAAKGSKKVVPHSSHHSLVTDFALHLMACIPNAGPFIEFSIEPGGPNDRGELYSPRLEAKDGKVNIPDGPGWGVTIHPEWLAAASYEKSERKVRK
jgi:L-alanine-DL-glutamate epimerase-like enolase superfamily enzyme